MHPSPGTRGESRGSRQRPEDGLKRPDDAIESIQALVSNLEAPRAVLAVRSSSADHEREAAVIEALEELTAAGVLDAMEVQTWPGKVSFNAAGPVGREFVEAFKTFDAWAEEHGVAIRPPFVVRDQDCSITEEHDEVLVTPMLFLSVWDGPELAGVYPCSHADGVTSVEECIAALRDGVDQTLERAGKTRRESATEPRRESGGEARREPGPDGETEESRIEESRVKQTPTAGTGSIESDDSDR